LWVFGFAVTMSGFVSPFKSPIATEWGPDPTVRVVTLKESGGRGVAVGIGLGTRVGVGAGVAVWLPPHATIPVTVSSRAQIIARSFIF